MDRMCDEIIRKETMYLNPAFIARSQVMDLLNKLYKKYAENKENSAPKTSTATASTQPEKAAEAPVEGRKGNWLQRNRFVNY